MFKRSDSLLPILIAAYVLLALGYSVVVPLGEAPDEVSHFAYIQSLAQDRQLPAPTGAAAGEAHQAPLYYLLGAAVSLWIPDQQFQFIANPDWELDNADTPNLLLHTRAEAFLYRGGALAWQLARLVSIALGAATVVVTFLLAREFAPHSQSVPLLASALIAFLPQFTYLSAMVNNDNLLIALCALALFYLLHSFDSARRETCVILGILLGVALLAKLTAVTLWAACAFAILIGVRPSSLSNRLQSFVITFGVAGVVVSPWIIFNAIAFGDPLNWARFLAVNPRSEPFGWSDARFFALNMFETSWGKFGGASHLRLPTAIYLVFTGLAALGVIGIAREIRERRLEFPKRKFLIALVFLAFLFASQMRLATMQWGMDQARHVFAGLPLVAIVAAVALARWLPRAHHIAVLAALIATTSAASLLYVASLYHPPTLTRPIAAPAPDTLDFGQRIRVTAYRIDSARATLGDSIQVEIEWQALTNLDETYWLLLQLKDGERVIANKEGTPSAGRVTTDWWQAGQVFSSRHQVEIPGDAAPGVYQLRLGLHPFARWAWLAVRGQETTTLGQIVVK